MMADLEKFKSGVEWACPRVSNLWSFLMTARYPTRTCAPLLCLSFPGHMHLVSLCQSACKAREIYSFLPRVPTSKFILCFFVSLSQNWQRVSIITSFSPLLSSSSRPWICTPLACHTQWESCMSKFTFRHCQNWLATPNHYINPPIFPFPPLLINFHPLHLISSYIILCILSQRHVAKQQQHQDASSCHLLRSPSQGQWYLCRLWIALPYDKWVYYLLFELLLTPLTPSTLQSTALFILDEQQTVQHR